MASNIVLGRTGGGTVTLAPAPGTSHLVVDPLAGYYLPAAGGVTTVQDYLRLVESGLLLKAAKGNNTDITSLTSISSINGGQLAGFRNLLINGGCQIAQYGTKAIVNNVWQYGGVDRITVGVDGFTAVSGSISQIQLPGTLSGYQQSATGVTTTGSGTIQFGQKIEAVNCQHLNEKQVTISGKLYHDAGASITCSFVLCKSAIKDSWSAPIYVQIVSLGAVPSGVMTPFSVTLTLGASDATNGLWPILTFPVGAVTGRTFAIADFQLEQGTVATAFERRDFGLEQTLCKRYFESIASYQISNYGAATLGCGHQIFFNVQKRALPTIVQTNAAATNCSTQTYANNLNIQGFTAYRLVTTTGNYAFVESTTANAEL